MKISSIQSKVSNDTIVEKLNHIFGLKVKLKDEVLKIHHGNEVYSVNLGDTNLYPIDGIIKYAVIKAVIGSWIENTDKPYSVAVFISNDTINIFSNEPIGKVFITIDFKNNKIVNKLGLDNATAKTINEVFNVFISKEG